MTNARNSLLLQRLRRLFRGIQVLQVNGEAHISDLIDYMKVPERSLVRYISILEKLKLVKRTSRGKISVNPDYIKFLEDKLGFKPAQLTLDDFMHVLDQATAVFKLRDYAYSLLEKLKQPLINARDLRDKLITTSPPDMLGGNSNNNLKCYGERVILPHFASESSFHQNVAGLSTLGHASFMFPAKYAKLKAFYQPFVCLYITFLSSAAHVSCYESGHRVKDFDPMFRPDVRKLKEDELPFRELFTEFRALRATSLSLALHYLSEANLYRLWIELLESHGGKIDVCFRLGSLIPHGFLSALGSRDPAVQRLQSEFLDTFDSFLKVTRDLGIVAVGVVRKPRDSLFSDVISKKIDMLNGDFRFHDAFFLSMLMEEADVTCLIQRNEKGKHLKDYFEFYMRNYGHVVRYDFIRPSSSNEPIKIQEEIAKIAYTISEPYPKQPFIIPAVVHEASQLCKNLLKDLVIHSRPAFEYAYDKLEADILDAKIRHCSL